MASLTSTITHKHSIHAVKSPTIPCKKCKQCNKQNHAKFLHSFTVSSFQAVLMAVPLFHLYNTEAKGRSPGELNYSYTFSRRGVLILGKPEIYQTPESHFNLLLRLIASKNIYFFKKQCHFTPFLVYSQLCLTF